jgi:hypothetical protein
MVALIDGRLAPGVIARGFHAARRKPILNGAPRSGKPVCDARSRELRGPRRKLVWRAWLDYDFAV